MRPQNLANPRNVKLRKQPQAEGGVSQSCRVVDLAQQVTPKVRLELDGHQGDATGPDPRL
jgi:hypothetical protein